MCHVYNSCQKGGSVKPPEPPLHTGLTYVPNVVWWEVFCVMRLVH